MNNPENKHRLAILDVDGTLYNGNLGIEFLKSLIKDRVFDEQTGQGIFSLYGKYKNGEIEKSVAVDGIYELFANGLKGKSQDQAGAIAVKTWQEVSSEMYGFATELVNYLKEKGFLVLIISGSPIEMISCLANVLDIDSQYVAAGRLEVIDGLYTGNIVTYPGSPEQKVQALEAILKRNNINPDRQKSLAMGDNERDLGLFASVHTPIAFRPNDALRQEAKDRGWLVVDENSVIEEIQKL